MNFVKAGLDEREKNIIIKRNLSINIDKRIANPLSSPQMASSKFLIVLYYIMNKGKLIKLLK